MGKLNELQAKLSELFELDKADLDFGIHRIVKTKHEQVKQYLAERLPARVREVLGQVANAHAGQRLDQARRHLLQTLGSPAIMGDGNLDEKFLETPVGSEYQMAFEEYKFAQQAEQAEAEVYSHLYEFFSRYYEDGDFISMRRRRAGREAYAIPYNGEEVMLHWANKDQYYIKSTEDLKDYTYTLPIDPLGTKGRVKFKVTRMDAVQNNNKASRIFYLDAEADIEASDTELVVPFYFAEGKKRNQDEERDWEQSVLDAIPDPWKGLLAVPDQTSTSTPRPSVLQRHLRNFTRKNTSDYFIHKDLGGFLRSELDFYIKNEMLYLDDVDDRPVEDMERELRKIKTLRAIAHDLIDFLAQLENFQKKLWLKKKMVLEANWCITLDRVPEDLYPEIASNDEQREKWIELFSIDEIGHTAGDLRGVNGPVYSNPLTVEFLQAHKYLLLDTGLFDRGFKDRLMATVPDIDAQTDGLLVHSENFQALNLLGRRFKGHIDCTYIDPPYNTGDSEILYKNEYMESCWLSMMASRLRIAKYLQNEHDCVLYIAIDEFEMAKLVAMIETCFPEMKHEMVIVNHHPQGGKATLLANTHEYMIVCVPAGSSRRLVGTLTSEGDEERPFKRSGTAASNFRKRRYKSFYALLIDPKTLDIVGAEPPPAPYDTAYPIGRTEQGFLRVYPIGQDGQERVWRRAYSSCSKLISERRLKCTETLTIYHLLGPDERTSVLFSNWTGSRYNAGTMGATLLSNIIGTHNSFSYPKSVFTVYDAIFALDEDDALVLDFFAGSGTTGHAVINLNREDGGDRKYILVEMGEYFDTVLVPRIQKVIYSPEWRDGKPVARDGGVSHCFKYMRLESYEDTLNNLTLEDRSTDLLGLRHFSEALADDYLLRYSLDVETRESLLALEAFKTPFNAILKVYNRVSGEAEPCIVDLPETFNYLLGLRVRTRKVVDGVLVIEGLDPSNERVLVIWRTLAECNNAMLEDIVYNKLGLALHQTDFAAIYINGDCTLIDPLGRVRLTESEFYSLMFDEQVQ